ncbi:hypothetical protein B0T24DRAFT_254117 [Lasiosphaeria ovina]|uniref:Uncharacterized protein n=1 Tax=Lasiosphaeria ovina TaxID=92902 RepID=A0AAE0N8E4_9PEZI|nr:hypothetical protein B0T24DRAFT_254117 [Lasiosphaeria ovina]
MGRVRSRGQGPADRAAALSFFSVSRFTAAWQFHLNFRPPTYLPLVPTYLGVRLPPTYPTSRPKGSARRRPFPSSPISRTELDRGRHSRHPKATRPTRHSFLDKAPDRSRRRPGRRHPRRHLTDRLSTSRSAVQSLSSPNPRPPSFSDAASVTSPLGKSHALGLSSLHLGYDPARVLYPPIPQRVAAPRIVPRDIPIPLLQPLSRSTAAPRGDRQYRQTVFPNPHPAHRLLRDGH